MSTKKAGHQPLAELMTCLTETWRASDDLTYQKTQIQHAAPHDSSGLTKLT